MSENNFIDGDLFGDTPDGFGSNEWVHITGDFDVDTTVAAVRAAALRFMLVTEDGTEHESEDSVEDSGLYSTNFVSTPTIERDGLYWYVDCKGAIEAPMAATLRRILREELAAADVDGIRVLVGRSPTL